MSGIKNKKIISMGIKQNLVEETVMALKVFCEGTMDKDFLSSFSESFKVDTDDVKRLRGIIKDEFCNDSELAKMSYGIYVKSFPEVVLPEIVSIEITEDTKAQYIFDESTYNELITMLIDNDEFVKYLILQCFDILILTKEMENKSAINELLRIEIGSHIFTNISYMGKIYLDKYEKID